MVKGTQIQSTNSNTILVVPKGFETNLSNDVSLHNKGIGFGFFN